MHAKPTKEILVIMDITYMSGREQLSGIYRFASRKPNWRIQLRTDTEFQPINTLDLSGQVDGIILKMGKSLKAVSDYAGDAIPVTLIDSPHDCDAQPKNSAVVISDNLNVGKAAAEHFIALGRFATYAYVADPCDYEWSRDRYRGFSTTLESHGYKTECFHQSEGISAQEDVVELATWLKSFPKPIAVLAAYDVRASHVLEACQKNRLAVPRDVSILGIDNDPLVCENTRPRLSSIKLDNEGQGFAAAQVLNKLLSRKSPRPAGPIQCPHLRIVERESTAPVIPATYLVERALKIINDHACEGLRVSEIAKELDVSYRLLILRFKQICGITIREALIKQRLEEVKHLLKTTNYSTVRIARNCGFRSSVVLAHLFTRRMGCSMGRWRQQARASSR